MKARVIGVLLPKRSEFGKQHWMLFDGVEPRILAEFVDVIVRRCGE